jgi:DNA repair protein RadA/Sms
VSKAVSNFVCQQCGYSQVGWAGKCPTCGSWGSLVETIVRQEPGTSQSRNRQPAKPAVILSSIPSKQVARTSTQISELDRVLGGGLVPGQVVLIAGEPGIGKSTLLLQLSDKIGNRQQAIGNRKTSAKSLVPSAPVLYVSGEESGYQVKLRADRLKVKNKALSFMDETDVDTIVSVIEEQVDLALIVVDSIQTMTTGDLTGLAGSVGQVRECAARLLKIAKSKNIPLFLVGHVTKEGTVAGPAVLAHIVDTVLWFEGEKSLSLRLVRAVKNRFGPTDEVGIFSMEDGGLIPQENAEKIFLTKKGSKGIAGSIITSILSGTRPMLVEIQSLVVPTRMAFPKRAAQGIDSKRLELLLAVLIRRCGLPLYEYDVFVNVAGGLTVREPASDLAICLSIASSYFNKALDPKSIAIGEVGLLGEIREVVAEEKRVKEAKRLGFAIPITQTKFKYLSQAIKTLFR